MYLIEYIKQTQADFPLDSTSPVDVLTHLLYTNGNGVEFVDGNPVVVHDEGLRHTSFKDWYSHVVPFQDIKDRLNQDWNVNKQVKDYYNSITGMQQRFAEIKGEEYDAEATWVIASDRFWNRYDDIDSVENYTLVDLKNVDVLQTIVKRMEYSPCLNLSPSFYKQDLFTAETDKDLIEVATALSHAYINVMRKCIAGELEIKLFGGLDSDDLLKIYKTDIKTLTADISKMADI